LSEVSVLACVRQTQRELIELLKHEQASLAQAQRCSGIEGAAPLFTAILNYRHNASSRGEEGASATAGIESLGGYERTNYPLTVSVDDDGEGFWLTAQVDGRIEAGRITAYLHRAIEGLVDALEEAPQTPMRSLSVLPASERDQLLEQFNATRVSYPQEALVHELFEAQARRQPDAIAVVYEDQQLSYGELNRRANQLAHYLIECGVKPDTRVGLCVDRSVEMLIGVLGILKAGGAYVPLDPSYPAERLAWLLADAAPAVVLTQSRLLAQLPLSVGRVIALDAHWPQLATQPDRNIAASEVGLSARHLAYAMYTSGSTGRPKGVLIEHAGLRNYVRWGLGAYPVQAGQGSIVISSLAFDATITS
jgi:non-ribosomal peptide synthetase component F